MDERAEATERAVRAIAAGLGACDTPGEAVAYLTGARARLVPRLQVMRRRKREPGMAAYIELLVGEIDEAIEATFRPATVVRGEDIS